MYSKNESLDGQVPYLFLVVKVLLGFEFYWLKTKSFPTLKPNNTFVFCVGTSGR